MRASELLVYAQAAWALIDKEEKWTKHAYATTKEGLPVTESSEQAVRLGSSGALWRILMTPHKMAHTLDTILARLSAAAAVAGEISGINRWNEESDYKTVAAAWQKMLAELEQEAETP